MIPLIDLVAQYRLIQSEIDAAIQGVLAEGNYILGPNERALEEEVAAHLGVKHAVGVASGTDALVIALRAAEVGPGDEVIIPAYSFFATAGAVLHVGARPVFVDIYPDTYLMNMQEAEKVVTQHTKAIIPVHLYGLPADMNEVLTFASEHGLKVIEDNAQAFGAKYQGRYTATIGDLGCLSFFPTKNLGAYGDGGMVTTNDDRLAEKVRMLRTHGWKKKYFPEMLGYNSRLDEIQAAILRVKLKYVAAWNESRIALAERYTDALNKFGVRTPVSVADRTHVYHLYIIRVAQREQFQKQLKELGVASAVYYPQPLHLSAPCRELGWKAGSLPVSEQAANETVAIAFFPEMTEEQIVTVFDAVEQLVKQGGLV
jgi:dTDP-4-amino-4,6-dideoxygalactose transaminase